MDTDFHNTSMDPAIRRPTDHAVDRPVVLGNNVWVGRNSIILKGVHIGDNSIVAAGSIIVKDIPSNQIYGGNPAQFIRILKE
jgi:acetyltransferase-like isoleucine patch superfamily enzyme